LSISPLLQRTYAQPLSLELLAEHVPVVKAGNEALEQLRSFGDGYKPSDAAERQSFNELHKKIRAGKKSQEILIISALPLIKNLVTNEFKRRKAWSSRVTYEDILQEGIAGFIRGLLSYKPLNTKNSATNYLGQWIISTVRRKTEVMEHDFFIPYEIVERNRRIVAVRSRLTTEMKREPTDEELLVALNDKSQKPGNKWGKSAKTETDAVSEVEPEVETETKRSNQFTQNHLDSSRQLSAKLYAMQSNEPGTEEEEGMYERSSATLSASEPMNISSVEEASVMESKRTFFLNVFIMMKIGSKQKDIILRFFGMLPYEEAQNYREIVAQTGLSSRFVKNVVMAFNQYMPQKGGVFHYQLLKLDDDEVIDLELDWLLPILGEWPERTKTPVLPPTVLTAAK
jgi:DNA-directed RNA polymerase specialized sigma subunit